MEQISNHSVCQRAMGRPRFRRLQLIGFLVVLLIGCWTGVTLAIRTDGAPPVTAADRFEGDVSPASPDEALTPPQPQGAGRRTIQTVTVSLGADRFRPTEVTQPRGTFFLMVENDTGLDQLNLRLDRETGNRIHEVEVPRQKRDWAEYFDLPPGRYFLTEANHPNWSCTITITPN